MFDYFSEYNKYIDQEIFEFVVVVECFQILLVVFFCYDLQ